MAGIINHIALSDIHIGAPKYMPEQVYLDFQLYVYPILTNDIDILTISGDFFDTALHLNSKNGLCALRIVDDLIKLAQKNKFYIRVLRGTYSHDRDQMKVFTRNTTPSLLGCDLVKVYSGIGYEYIKPLNLKMAYVPDDLPYEDDYLTLKQLLNEYKVDSVNVILSHCYYKHHIPEEYEKYISKSTSSDMMDLASNIVLNGHIHTGSNYKRILTMGSFGRWKHGEEERKGFYKVTYDPEVGGCTRRFIENKNATVFKTITLTQFEYNHDKAITYFKQELELCIKKEADVYIRIITNDAILKEVIIKYCYSKYVNVKISSKRSKEQKEKDTTYVCTVAELPTITPNNISTFTHRFLNMEFGIDMNIDEIIEIFEEIA